MSDRVFRQLKTMWGELYESKNAEKYTHEFIKSQFDFLNIASDNEMLVAVFNYITLKSEFVSDNIIDILGYSRETSFREGVNNYLSYIHPSHQAFAITGTQHFAELVDGEKKLKFTDIKTSFMGLRYNHPTKGEVKLLWQQYFLEEKEGNVPLHALFVIRDVTHLMKGDFYWFRITTINNELLNAYHSESKISLHDDVISIREKEILKMIEDGKETDEIASTLHISRNTVNNHRQNILNKLGIKDTTALISVAKMCHLLL